MFPPVFLDIGGLLHSEINPAGVMSNLHILYRGGLLVQKFYELLELRAVPRSNSVSVQLTKLFATVSHHKSAHDRQYHRIFAAQHEPQQPFDVLSYFANIIAARLGCLEHLGF